MLHHNVYFWLKPDVTEAQRAVFMEALQRLIRIDHIHHAFVGHPAATESREVTDHSFDVHLGLAFASQAEHDAYQDHPDHHAFVSECAGWWAKVQVLDSAD